MNVYVITKTHFTGADQYTSVFGVYADKELADSQVESMNRGSIGYAHASAHYHVTTHNLQEGY